METEQFVLEGLNIPKHIAIIMDGNGRWAKSKGKKRTAGHQAGGKALRQICEAAYRFRVDYLTVYAFSTENWKRAEEEVSFLMTLLRSYLKESLSESKRYNMQVRVIGDRDIFPKDIQESIRSLEQSSKDHTGLKLQIALNYGGRDELVRAFKDLGRDLLGQDLSIDGITEAVVGDYLDTKGIPDPELLIRTSGELRVSNFLLWQLAYSEFYFSDKFWPDFEPEDLYQAILAYNRIERRFGGVLSED